MKTSKIIFILMAVCGLMTACDNWNSFDANDCNPYDETITKIDSKYYKCERGNFVETYPECVNLGSYQYTTNNNGGCIEEQCIGFEWVTINSNQFSCVTINGKNVGIGECLNGTNSCKAEDANENTPFKVCVNGQYQKMSENCGCSNDSICIEVGKNYGMSCTNNLFNTCTNEKGEYTSCNSDNSDCGECLNGTEICDGNNVKRCEKGDWIDIHPCLNGCDSNTKQCKTQNSCETVGAFTCSEDNIVLRCNEQNILVNHLNCASENMKCKDGKCVECLDGSTQCNAASTEALVCKNNRWGSKQKCDENQVCEAGECKDKNAECTTNDKSSCNGQNRKYCEDGQWHEEPCGDKVCVDGECKEKTAECTTNDKPSCNGQNRKYCEDGQWHEEPCGDKVCENGECKDKTAECTGDNECNGNVCVSGVCVDSQSCSQPQRCNDKFIENCNGGTWMRESEPCPNGCIESEGKAYCKGECPENGTTINVSSDSKYICQNGTYITNNASCSDNHGPQCVNDDSASASIHCTNNQWDVDFCEIGCNEDEGRCICSSDDECPEDGGCYTKYEVTMGVCISEGDVCDSNDSFCALNNTVLYSCDNGIWNKKECECDQRSNRCSDTHYVVGQRCTNSEETTESDGLTLICLEDQWYELVDNNSNCGPGNSNNGAKCGENDLDVCFSGYCVSTIAKDSESTRCFGGDLIGIKTDESKGIFEIYRCDDQNIGDSVVDKAGKIKKCQTVFNADGIAQSASCVDECVADSTGIGEEMLEHGVIYCNNTEADPSSFMCISSEYNDEFAFYISNIKAYCEGDSVIKLFSCVSENDGTFFYNSSESTTNNCEFCSKGICYKRIDNSQSKHICVECDTSVLTNMLSLISEDDKNKITNFWCSENTKIIGVKDVSGQSHLVYCLPDQQCDEGECITK